MQPIHQDEIEQFLRVYYADEIAELARHYPREQQSLHVDWNDLFQFDHELADDLLDDPERVLQAFEAALAAYDVPIDVSLDQAHVRVHNLPEEYDPAEVSRTQHIGRLVGITGQVAKVSDVKPKAVVAAFRCQRCECVTEVPQTGDQFREPPECRSCERQGPFQLEADQSTLVDHQDARIQQPPERTQDGNAQHVDVRLEDDLIEQFETGDRVTVSGMLQLESQQGDKPVFDTSIEGVDVVREESDYEDLDVDEHLEEIQEIASGERGDPYDLVVESIHPKHQGDEDIKLAIALQLFGGWAREYPDGSRDRGDSHILLLGDPGCGKSSFLHAIDELAPRSTYASGKGATAAGMTAAAVRDDFGDSEWGLEAGALVLADGGVVCVDEIDKVSADAVSSMHDALESQQVHVNKGGFNTTLNARSALLAAGNPKHGRFDKYEPIGTQIDMDPALLSRFDLLFMLSDEPDREEDRDVVDTMIESRRAGGKYTLDEELTDAERETVEPAIDHDVLRAYIAHAKESCFPLIRDEAVKEALSQYFVELRVSNVDSASDDNPVPVTYRKEQAMERLAEASARIRLSETVELQDVKRAVRLIEQSMRQVGRDAETGQFDADIIETGLSTTQRDRKQLILNAIEECGGATLDKLDRELEDIGRGVIEDELAVLSTEDGEIYDLGNGEYRRI